MDKLSTNTAIKIGERITKIRLGQGTTQAEAAQKAELSTNYYARIERGDANATVEALQRIAQVLKVKSSDILPF
jgi:transcriptional regulator with XRE-family HTH domain